MSFLNDDDDVKKKRKKKKSTHQHQSTVNMMFVIDYAGATLK